MSRKNNRNKIKAQYELEVRLSPCAVVHLCMDCAGMTGGVHWMSCRVLEQTGREGEGAQGEAAKEA